MPKNDEIITTKELYLRKNKKSNENIFNKCPCCLKEEHPHLINTRKIAVGHSKITKKQKDCIAS
jgi:hypothetical protein